jgi:hypothetical protein
VTRRVLFVIGAVLLLLVARGMFEGRAAIKRAYAYDAQGNVEGAIANAMRATKWYVPLASHPREGYDLLRTIARRAESVGDVDTALIAWQAIRAGAHATRSLYTPFADRAREADTQIAILLAARPPPGIDKDKPREKIVQEHRQDLARTDGPNALAVVALYGGLALVLFGAYRALEKFEGEAEVARRRRMTSLAIAVAGFVTVILAFARA